jgi:hypothetical protein
VNVRTVFADWLPAASTDHAVTVYVVPFVSWLVASGTLQVVVPVAVIVADAVCHALPVQYWLLLERWMVIRTLARPEPVSAAVPQSREVPCVQPPADQVVAL